jgi:hypothetical protein
VAASPATEAPTTANAATTGCAARRAAPAATSWSARATAEIAVAAGPAAAATRPSVTIVLRVLSSSFLKPSAASSACFAIACAAGSITVPNAVPMSFALLTRPCIRLSSESAERTASPCAEVVSRTMIA